MQFGLVEVSGMRRRLRHAQVFACRYMQDLPAEATIAQQCIHMIVTGEEPRLLLFPVKRRTGGMQGRISAVRIAVERWIARIERYTTGGGINREEGKIGHGACLTELRVGARNTDALN